MAFDRARVAAAALVLTASSAGAGASLDSPRLLVACALAGLIAAAFGWAALTRLARQHAGDEQARRIQRRARTDRARGQHERGRNYAGAIKGHACPAAGTAPRG